MVRHKVYLQGNNRMFRKLILLLVSMVSIFSGSALAVGLGEYELNSGLNQPLNAKITLLSAGELSEHEVHASVASLQEFEKVGVERLFFLNNIRFETVRNDNGVIEVHLSTREPIKEPFLNFLVELNWPNGRMIREYTFLLDPPVFEDTSSSTIEKTKAKKSAERQAPQTRSSASQTASQSSGQSSFTGSSYGPVSANDTLWSIASRTRPNNQVSIHQTLVAIYRANPQAFVNGNINNLKRGEVLNIPDAQMIAQVPHRAALQDVVVQNREWRSGGARRIVENQSSGTATREISGDARLSLSTPGNSASGNASNSTGLRNQLAQTESQLVQSQEKSATLEAENEELRARLADALSQLENVKKDGAISIDDADLAVLSNKKSDEVEGSDSTTTEQGSTEMGTDSSVVGSEIADTASVENGSDTGANDSGSIDSTATDNQVSDASANKQDNSASTQANTTKTASSTATKPPVFNSQKAADNNILGLEPMYWGGIAAVLMLIAFAVFWRMRKRMEEEDFQDDLVASAGAGALDSTESFELPDVGDDMLVELDMDDDDSDAEKDEENFDPIGEADIYIAYGKYEQAESLLKEAIDDNPIRSDLKVKLMECYAETEDKEQFESYAQEVSQAVDAEEWESQIAELRQKAFGGAGQQEDEFDLPSTEDIFGDDDSFDSGIDDMGEPEADTSAESNDFAESDEDEFDIDMDLGSDDDSDNEEDFSLDDIDASESVTETFDSLDDEDFSLDDDGGLEDELSAESDISDELDEEFSLDIEEGEEDSISLDDDDLSLDLDDDDFSFDDEEDDLSEDDDAQGEDEISTKLDLARAYIDMGDSDGAKEILNEVVAEGTDEQQADAKSLLDKID